MYKLIFLPAILTSLLFCSCKKENQKPLKTSTTDTTVISRWVCVNQHIVYSGYLSGVKMPGWYYYFNGLPDKIDFRKDSSYAFKNQFGRPTDSVYCKGRYSMYRDSIILYDTRKDVIDGCKKYFGTDVAFSVIYFKSSDSLVEARSAQLWNQEVCSNDYDGFFFSGQYRIEHP